MNSFPWPSEVNVGGNIKPLVGVKGSKVTFLFPASPELMVLQMT